MQPQKAVVLGHRREQFGVKHCTNLVGHVVVHSLGMYDSLTLAEDNVALHVYLQRNLGVLSGLTRKVGLLDAGGPNYQPVGRHVD